jgi:hypothetical protein
MTNRFDHFRATSRAWLRAPIGYAKRLTARLRGPYRHKLAICAIFREEAPFLDEWITFHAGVGVTHFYLYNNFSTDDFEEVLRPWIARGIVTLTDWPIAVGQLAAYRHCLERARNECRWLAFINIDEFLFSPRGEDVSCVLDRYVDLPGVMVWQLNFGSNGHISRPDLPVTEAYVRRARSSLVTAKTIVDPRQVYKVGIHRSKYWLGDALDTSRGRVNKSSTPVFDVLRTNHYWSRSLADLETKIQRTDASTPLPRDRDTHFAYETSLNAELDETILPVSRAVRGRAVM